jgi:hypothetical protein
LLSAFGDVHSGDEDENDAAGLVPDRYEGNVGIVLRAVLEDIAGFPREGSPRAARSNLFRKRVGPDGSWPQRRDVDVNRSQLS